jgi:predicted MPP superfamily phosphohydrolase
MRLGNILQGWQNRVTAPRIWDLRRGDYEDNRTSSHVHGLRRVLLSAALEFSYLKAVISFLTLIIGPALLIGLAPSVVVTYGQLNLETTAMIGTRPVLVLVVLAILVGAAVWLGRPLIRLAVEKFWDLHQALVFPIFIAAREMMNMIAERVPTQAATPEQISRRRRVGTILAALLLAGGGLAFTIALGISMGLQIVDVRRAHPWVMAKASFINAAMVLGLSTCVESLYWLWRELTLSGPVLDWTPSPLSAQSPGVRVAHLSDLHLVGERYGARMEAGTEGPRGNRRLSRTLRKLAEMHASTPLDHIMVTGDITDAGTRAEWAEFLDLLRSYPQLRARLSFVPGNHDVNIVDRTNPGRLDLPWSAGQALRKLRVLVALDAIQGERAHIVSRASGALGPSLKEYLREGKRAERLRALADKGTARGRAEIAVVWDAIFPLVEPAPSEDGYGLILLNSNARSHFSLTNAIGVIDSPQLRALKAILRNFPRRAWVILLHHQIVEYPVTSISLGDRIGLALVNAPDLVAAIAPYASRILVFHGHRHWDWIGTCSGVVLCSAPSTMVGSHNSEKNRGCFHVHQLAVCKDGGLRLAATERVEVA